LKADTLRVWERRYGLGSSHKSASGRRQYSQTDLEHLQLVSMLVKSGARIGEIAKSGTRTLEFLVRSLKTEERADITSKPRVLFLGQGICNWLDQHQGCLSNVDANLARISLDEAASSSLPGQEKVDVLVVECRTVSSSQLQHLDTLVQRLQPGKVLLTYHEASEQRLGQLAKGGIAACVFPPEAAYLGYEISRSVTDRMTRLGENNLGELIEGRARQFSDKTLAEVAEMPAKLDCECPQHLVELIRALSEFENYSANCSVDNWRDAAVHSCIYAYTGQARWLMEKALQAVLEEEGAKVASA
jgi:hypothetical protein